MEEEEIIEKRKEKIRSFLKNRENFLLFILIVSLVIFRLYYFFKLGGQPIWWDEGDYLAISKVWALKMPLPEWWSHFTGIRPLLLPLIWTAFFKAGFGELFIRFTTLLIPSIFSIYLVYLIGRDLYNKKVGLISGLMLAVYWVFTFYTYRLLTDIPATMFGLLSFYFFWSHYIKKNRPSGLYLALLFGVLGFSTRYPVALIPMVLAVYLLFTRKLKIFKDKTIWKAGILLILFLLPYIIYLASTKFLLFQFYFGEKAVSVKQPIAWYIPGFLFSLLHSFWQIAFVLGLITIIPLFIAFDMFLKQRNKKLNPDFIVVLWLVIHLFFYMFILRGANDRWLLMLMPPMFFIAAKGIVLSYDFLKKYSKTFAIIMFALLLFGGVYQNLKHSVNLIESKKTSYKEIKDAGLWLKENTPRNSKIITASIVQNQYYSERDSYDFYNQNITLPEDCVDLFGKLNNNETCQKASEEAFNKKISKTRPDYFIMSVFEPVFTPQWAYTYPQRYNLTFVKAFFPNNDMTQQPVLIIFAFPKEAESVKIISAENLINDTGKNP